MRETLRILRPSAALLLASVLSACGAPGAGGVPRLAQSAQGPLSTVDKLPHAVTSAHLYVSSVVGDVFRYPINGGVVAPSPDLTLHTMSCGSCAFRSAYAIALDSQNNLYISILDGDTAIIKEYAPGASGSATPIRTLTQVPLGLGGVAVDSQGNVYAVGNERLAVYPPGSTTPIRILSVPKDSNAIVVGAGGTLYVASTGVISAFAHPLRNQKPTYQICSGTYVADGPSMYGIAVGVVHGARRIYASQTINTKKSPLAGRIGVWDAPLANRPCPQPSSQHILSIGASPQAYQPKTIALDIADNLLFVANPAGDVYGLNPMTFKQQSPIVKLDPGISWGIAVGP
jgi:hypothetical protein